MLSLLLFFYLKTLSLHLVINLSLFQITRQSLLDDISCKTCLNFFFLKQELIKQVMQGGREWTVSSREFLLVVRITSLNVPNVSKTQSGLIPTKRDWNNNLVSFNGINVPNKNKSKKKSLLYISLPLLGESGVLEENQTKSFLNKKNNKSIYLKKHNNKKDTQ